MYIILLQSRSSSFLSRLFVAERNSTNGGVEMECIQASCMHLFPYPGNRSCRNSNAAARELVIARSVEGETAGGFRPSCSYGIQGPSSARRKCREEGFKGQQKFILQANKNLGRNRIDTLETVDDVVLLGNIFLHPRAPHRRKSGVCHVIPTIGENNARSTVKEFGDSDSLGKAFSPWVRGNEYRGERGLNHRLVNAVDADSVLAEVTEVLARSHWRSASLLLSPLNSATALHRIAKHMDQASMSKSERLAFARRKEMVELQNAAIKALSKSSVQGISNIAWALSKIGGSAIYFGEMDIVAKAASDCVEEFKPQNLANTAGAFASMQHLSSPLFSSMSQQASLVAADFRPQELVQFLWAFACMNHPLDAFFDSLDSLVQKESFMNTSLFKNLSQQQLASIAWSCTVLAQLERPWFAHLWTTLADHADSWVIDVDDRQVKGARHLSQLYQTNLSLQLEYPNLDLSIGSELEQVLSEAWQKEKVNSKCSSIHHKEVDRLLVGTGRDWVCEYTGAEYSVDLALVESKIALEIDGPTHFARNTDVLLGHTVLKRRLLSASGWTVIPLPYQEVWKKGHDLDLVSVLLAQWEELRGEQERMQYLHQVLHDYI